MYVCTHAHTHTHTQTHTHTHTQHSLTHNIYIHIYTYVYGYICRERERENDLIAHSRRDAAQVSRTPSCSILLSQVSQIVGILDKLERSSCVSICTFVPVQQVNWVPGGVYLKRTPAQCSARPHALTQPVYLLHMCVCTCTYVYTCYTHTHTHVRSAVPDRMRWLNLYIDYRL
jgi:hypothetical protein